MLASILGAMVVNLGEFDDPLLRIMGGVLVLLGLGVLVESARALLRPRPSTPPPA